MPAPVTPAQRPGGRSAALCEPGLSHVKRLQECQQPSMHCYKVLVADDLLSDAACGLFLVFEVIKSRKADGNNTVPVKDKTPL